MKTRIVRMGDSHGVLIPGQLLKESGLRGEVEITAREGAIVISPVRGRREGWAESFQNMAVRGDAALVDGDQLHASSWDEDQWEW